MKRNYKYNIGDVIECKDGSHNLIIDKTMGKQGESAYICNCDKGHTYMKAQTRITTRCPYCIKFVVEKGVNDISVTNKEMFSMIKDKDFAYTHHDNSKEYTEFICPICKNIVVRSPYIIKKFGFRCPHCSIGYSYGEKFFINFLDMMNIEHITQYSSKDAKWCKKYRYDFYLKKYDCIIEVHGMQHYKDTTWSSYDEIHKNDLDKKDLAQKHVKYYIVIDARKSESDYIKQSILSSELNQLLSLSSYNTDAFWKEIHSKSIIPFIKEIAEKYNNYSKDVSELSELFHFSKPTIRYYLKEASLLNLCDYDPNYNIEKTLKDNHANNSERDSKPLKCLEDSRVFRNARVLQNISIDLYNTNLDFRAISMACNGKLKSYKNLHFSFISRNEFNRTKDNDPDLAFGDKFIKLEDVA